MRFSSSLFVVSAVSTLALISCGKAQKMPEELKTADAIFVGKIYTGAEKQPVVKTVATQYGKIVGVYDEEFSFEENDPRVTYFGKAVAFPGFTDAHAHLSGIGFREMTLNLEGTSSIEELKQRVGEAAKSAKEGELVYGRGWIETGWPEGRFPNRQDLDEVAPNNPVYLRRADGHAAVVNSKAIELSSITAETADPAGGAILRDDDGVATGMLIDNAQALVSGLIEAPTRERKKEALQRGAQVYAQYGWTSIHSMSVAPDEPELMQELEEAGKLPIRVYNSLTPEGLDGLIETGIWEVNDGKIITRAVKFYVDGALGSRGAALHEPYSDDPMNKGLLLMSPEEAKAAYEKALANSIQVTTHAIGDRGNTLVLDWYQDAMTGYKDDPRWRIEHAQVLTPDDISRFAGQRIIASMQPSHAIGDLHFAPDRLGDERLAGAYAWRSLSDAGAIITGGSDAPVERGDPMIEFYAAVGRTDLKGYQGDNWQKDQVLTREEALKIFTINPAFASFNEDRIGTIEVGKSADFSVFSNDIMEVPLAEIPKTKAVLTIVDGRIVFDGRKAN